MSDYEVYGYVSAREQPQDDAQPVKDARLSDLNGEALDDYTSLQTRRPGMRLRELDRIQQLIRLRIASGDSGEAWPTLAGLLMFGQFPQQFFPSIMITFLRYAGVDETTPGPRGERFFDNKKFEGPIPVMLDEAHAYVMSAMRTGALITGLYRQDMPEYPETAVREALVNAIAHRDYSNYTKGSQIQVRMLTDRLEVQSPGGLFGAVTEDNIDREQSTRNPVLMRMLEDLHLVENRGSGISTMIRTMRQANLEPPSFSDRRSSFWVTFRNHTMMDSAAVAWLGGFADLNLNDRQRTSLVYLRRHGRMVNREYQRLNSVDGPTATRELHGLVAADLAEQHSTRGGAFYRLVESLRESPMPAHPLTEDEQRILRHVREHGSVRSGEVQRLLGWSRGRTFYVLTRMVDSGILRRTGAGKNTRYTA